MAKEILEKQNPRQKKGAKAAHSLILGSSECVPMHGKGNSTGVVVGMVPRCAATLDSLGDQEREAGGPVSQTECD